MAALVTLVATAALAGIDPTAGLVTPTAGTGDTFVADAETWLRVTNTSGASVTVLVTPPAASGPRGTTIAPQTFGPVPATTGDRFFGPFPQNPYGDANGNVNIQVSATTSVKIGAIKFSG